MLKVGSDVVVAAIPGDSTGSSVYMWGRNLSGWRAWLHVTNRAMLGASLHRSYLVSLSFCTLTRAHAHTHTHTHTQTHTDHSTHPPKFSPNTSNLSISLKRHLQIFLYFVAGFYTPNVK